MRISNLMVVIAALAACNQNNQNNQATNEKSIVKETTQSEQSNTGEAVAEQPEEDGAGSLQFGTVELAVLPVSTSSSYLVANDERNAADGAGGLNLPDPSSASLQLSGSSQRTKPVPHPLNISSGTADELKLFIRKIALKPREGPAAVLFEDAAGAEVYIKESGEIDLSKLIAAAKQPETEVNQPSTPTGTQSGASLLADESSVAKAGAQAGSYTEVEVEYLLGAEVKGCVQADWTSSVDHANSGGVRKYCTRAGKSTFTPPPAGQARTLDDFRYIENGTEAQTEVSLVTFNLSKSRESSTVALATDSMVVRYKTIDPIVIKAGESSPLTLMIDLNRILKFYRAVNVENGVEKSPNPSMEKGIGPYFFTTVFEESTAVFVGKPGKIFGYELVAESCLVTNLSGTGSSATCAVNPFAVIGGWMTLIFDAEKRPLYGIVQPDDDNDLTVIKGTGRSFTHEDTGIPNFIRPMAEDASKLEIRYALHAENNRLKGFTEDFFGAQRGTSFDGITFEADHGDGDQGGPIHVMRKL
jgi:hypothetical protein